MAQSSRLPFCLWQGGLDSSPTARIERAPFYRARSASTGDEPGCPAIPLEMKKPTGFHQQAFFVTRQRPTFPLPHSSSIIGLGGLNFRVRDGNGCGPSGKATGNIFEDVNRHSFNVSCRSSFLRLTNNDSRLTSAEDHVYQEQ